MSDRNAVTITEEESVAIHRTHALLSLGFSVQRAELLEAAGVDTHYADHLINDLNYTTDQTWELLR